MILESKYNTDINPEEYKERIKKLRNKINRLNKMARSEKLTKEIKSEILNSIVNDVDGNFCPFCGENFASVEGVKSHLSEKGDGLSYEEIEKMNTMPERSSNYRQEYIKQYDKKYEWILAVELDGFDEKAVDVKIREQIHHLISVDTYASTLRLSRLGNFFGFNINSLSNLIDVPAVDPKAFKEKYDKKYSELSDENKSKISKSIIGASKKQVHQGGHNSDPAEGIPSYEKRLVQAMAEIEHEIMMKSMENGECLGQTSEGREKVKIFFEEKIKELQEKISNDLNFNITDDNPMFLSGYNFNYYEENKEKIINKEGIKNEKVLYN